MKHLKTFENIFDNIPVEVAASDVEKHQMYRGLIVEPDFEDDEPTFDFFVLDKTEKRILIIVTDDLSETPLKHMTDFAKEYTLTDFMTLFSNTTNEDNIIEWDIIGKEIRTQYGHEVKIISAL